MNKLSSTLNTRVSPSSEMFHTSYPEKWTHKWDETIFLFSISDVSNVFEDGDTLEFSG